ncbi:hypothetical protein EVAR_82906_1 [Eumeta japonica]|uniref:Uncharacterized protein n=1 Tax=Eumeta variegata TaxID=151549 RepID=A0A4C1X4M2_EUMVA|nr:hypothetical protein EVAR_82906_1 [Eumeta japonica]
MPPKLRLRGQEVEWLRAEPRGVCYAQFFDRTYRSEPKLPCIKAKSVLGSRTQYQHGTYSAPYHRESESKPNRASP